MLDYYQIKNHYGSLIAGLIKQKEINADPKAIQQIEFVRQLKNLDGINAGGDNAQSILVYTILEKIKETHSKRSQGRVTVL